MTMFQRSNWQHDAEEQLSQQVSRLGRDVAEISRAVQRFGADARHEAGTVAADLAGEAWHQGEIVARGLGRRARRAGKAVREDPVPAIVAVAGFMLLLNLLLGRKQQTRR